ncbi:MAG: DUF4406 domain-containing protein [Bacteroidota bacterium]|jgi:hypothetical protein
MEKKSIKQGSIFICGPITGNLLKISKNFSLVEKALKDKGYNAVNQFSIYNIKGLNQYNFKYTLTLLINCNTIVTLKGWQDCSFAKKQIEIAIMIGIEVISYESL